jgi:hypothetical protein
VINAGGGLLLFTLLAGLLLLVQRTEPKRRIITFLFVLFGMYIVSAYGIYRMSGDCPFVLSGRCALPNYVERTRLIAYNTLNLAISAALIFNGLFWALIGRYNPPASSDEIRVLGIND